MTDTLIQKLTQIKGIETHYVDAWGNEATISTESQAKLLQVMGYDVTDSAALESKLDSEAREIWLSPLNPVQVVRQNENLVIALRLPIELVNDEYRLSIVQENGEQHTLLITPVEQELVQVAHIDEVEFHEYLVPVELAVEQGYHTLVLTPSDDEEPLASMRLVIAPQSCFSQDDILAGKKAWGLSIQLYCLRSQSNWGIGDFSDLAQVVRKSAGMGADFVGLNPIHALFPASPLSCSPYGPSSRRWLNYLYIDVTAVDGYAEPNVQEVVNTEAFQTRLSEVRATDYVDYEGVAELKLTALRAIFDHVNPHYLSKNTRQNRAFKAFVKAGGESLDMLAVFDALQADLKASDKPYWGWPVFPQEYQDYHSAGVAKFKKKHATEIKFYLFLQWIASEQLQRASDVADECNMTIGLYRDLAVGVSEGSAEVWGNQSLYCTDASIGAPPDILGPLGQNWGLPPMSPEQLYQQQYQPIIDLFSANMTASGALRIDHVMALLRLWWVTKGHDAKEGGYVYYPVDDLLGILALESHRNRSLVIGEDLGTVPDEIRLKLAQNGVYSYRVFFFEQAEDGGFFSPAHYPVQSMSTLTTHDMPTLTGYWHCLDLELGREIGLYPTDAILSSLYEDRHTSKQAILDSLHGHGMVSDEVGRDVNYTGMSQALNFGLQVHMAHGSSALLSLQLEDWLQMDKPVNVPGTFNEYPNWRRKLSKSIEETFSAPELIDLAEKLTQARHQASTAQQDRK